MADLSPLDEQCVRVLKAIVELAKDAPPLPHIHVPEVAALTGLPEQGVAGCCRRLAPKYIEVVDEHLPYSDPGGLTVMGITEEGSRAAENAGG